MAVLLINLGQALDFFAKPSEAEVQFREALAISRGWSDSGGWDVLRALVQLSENLYRQGKYAESVPFFREKVERVRADLPFDEDEWLLSLSSTARALTDWAWNERGLPSEDKDRKTENAGRAREAVSLLRDCLAIRLRGNDKTNWRISDVQSRLGGALVAVAVTDSALTSGARLAKLTEAGSLLLEANEVLQLGKEVKSKYKSDSLTRLIRLYEAWDKPDKAAEWQQKLDDFNKTEK